MTSADQLEAAPASSQPTAGSVGLVHDYLLVMRGAERTFAAIAECWPEAPLYTTVYSQEGTEGRFAGRQIHTSYLQRLRPSQATFRRLLPLYPRAVESLPVAEHDLIVSSSSAFAHGIHPSRSAIHVCYCHTPFRYAWHERESALASTSPPLRPLLKAALKRIRAWDREASRRVSAYIANSELVRERIAACYERDSVVVHPPVEVERFAPGEAEDAFLVVSELTRHKRIALALAAAQLAGVPIKVVGEGPQLRRLRAGFPDVTFVGRVGDQELAGLYSRARALIVPTTEEFGIAAVEAQAAGRPVVALDAGGARETVIDGVTGVLVDKATPQAFAEVLRSVDFSSFSPETIHAHAQSYSRSAFKAKLRQVVARLLRGR